MPNEEQAISLQEWRGWRSESGACVSASITKLIRIYGKVVKLELLVNITDSYQPNIKTPLEHYERHLRVHLATCLIVLSPTPILAEAFSRILTRYL